MSSYSDCHRHDSATQWAVQQDAAFPTGMSCEEASCSEQRARVWGCVIHADGICLGTACTPIVAPACFTCAAPTS